MSKSVLYISYDGMTDPLGQSQVIPYLRGLSAKGYNITILSFEKREAFKSIHKLIESDLNNNNIAWVPLRYHAKPPVISTLLDLWHMWGQVKQLNRNTEFDIVHCRSYLASLIGLKMKKRYGTKFIFDMRGFWADERVEGKLWHIKNPLYKAIYRFFKRKEREFLNKADYTISLTEEGKKEIEAWARVANQSKIKVIPCCVDTNHFSPSSNLNEDFKTDIGLANNNFVLTYLGSIGTWYMLDEMLAFFKILKLHYPNAKFLFLTPEDPQTITGKGLEHGINLEDIIVRVVPRADVPRYLQVTDFSIFFISPSFSKKASSPTKLAELLSLEVPIICNTGIGDVDQIIRNSNCGILINEFNDASYAQAISKIATGRFENLRQTAIEKFSLIKGVAAYDEVYQSL